MTVDIRFDSPLGAVETGDATWRRRGRLRRSLAACLPLLRRPGFLLALAVVAFALLAAVAPGLLSGFDPYATAPADKLRPPDATHWFGTDELGRDLYTRVVHGASLSVLAALLAVGIALAGGLGLGILSGFAGGRLDAFIMRFIDVLLALPGLLLALAIVTAIGFGTVPVAIAVGVALVPGFARTTRAEVLRVKTLPYVEAARLGGASWTRTLLLHILPNAWSPVAVLATLDFGAAILATAGLSFLGFGAAPPAAEWGTLISNGRHFLITAPWVSLLPGLFLVAVVFSLNHIARTLEEVQR
ncbi:ABC transporter, inner membrane permease component [Azotobacter vinelandii CA]|uniref:ABC transporter, inner membrane permease component n=2 Tax=Azotobacter vinelandii TaxID=354 RepID=C1DDW0_AZOVD|nr:ABC transporter permease [Azotobacter vinelandii]ACO78081.1 ABC transporter, inner membrane permease component [Azotobacter vinelandii DJ]AGK15130.1 ABC transporter, inner membrane permease component [Azotobacter vinelandii CA]AGK20237.1 ABC transporter, inner membrane permease component [Azotobacter vinelandii CA6]SFY06684.1 peptide/nickel transport system permease protein [Azotobacter vinelandii]GLK61983.1 ABC transporter permease [Azotobacter vinelandii]